MLCLWEMVLMLFCIVLMFLNSLEIFYKIYWDMFWMCNISVMVIVILFVEIKDFC